MSTFPFAHVTSTEMTVLVNNKPTNGAYNPKTQVWEYDDLPTWEYAKPTKKRTNERFTGYGVTSPCGQDAYWEWSDEEAD